MLRQKPLYTNSFVSTILIVLNLKKSFIKPSLNFIILLSIGIICSLLVRFDFTFNTFSSLHILDKIFILTFSSCYSAYLFMLVFYYFTQAYLFFKFYLTIDNKRSKFKYFLLYYLLFFYFIFITFYLLNINYYFINVLNIHYFKDFFNILLIIALTIGVYSSIYYKNKEFSFYHKQISKISKYLIIAYFAIWLFIFIIRVLFNLEIIKFNTIYCQGSEDVPGEGSQMNTSPSKSSMGSSLKRSSSDSDLIRNKNKKPKIEISGNRSKHLVVKGNNSDIRVADNEITSLIIDNSNININFNNPNISSNFDNNNNNPNISNNNNNKELILKRTSSKPSLKGKERAIEPIYKSESSNYIKDYQNNFTYPVNVIPFSLEDSDIIDQSMVSQPLIIPQHLDYNLPSSSTSNYISSYFNSNTNLSSTYYKPINSSVEYLIPTDKISLINDQCLLKNPPLFRGDFNILTNNNIDNRNLNLWNELRNSTNDSPKIKDNMLKLTTQNFNIKKIIEGIPTLNSYNPSPFKSILNIEFVSLFDIFNITNNFVALVLNKISLLKTINELMKDLDIDYNNFLYEIEINSLETFLNQNFKDLLVIENTKSISHKKFNILLEKLRLIVNRISKDPLNKNIKFKINNPFEFIHYPNKIIFMNGYCNLILRDQNYFQSFKANSVSDAYFKLIINNILNLDNDTINLLESELTRMNNLDLDDFFFSIGLLSPENYESNKLFDFNKSNKFKTVDLKFFSTRTFSLNNGRFTLHEEIGDPLSNFTLFDLLSIKEYETKSFQILKRTSIYVYRYALGISSNLYNFEINSTNLENIFTKDYSDILYDKTFSNDMQVVLFSKIRDIIKIIKNDPLNKYIELNLNTPLDLVKIKNNVVFLNGYCNLIFTDEKLVKSFECSNISDAYDKFTSLNFPTLSENNRNLVLNELKRLRNLELNDVD